MGSPFASLTKSDPIPVPFDPPHTIVVRKLTGREFEQAQESHARGVALGRSRVWSQTFATVLEQGLVKARELAAVMSDPLLGFDRFDVIRSGLVSWTYDAPIKAVAAVPASGDTPPSEAYDPILDLDDEMLEFVATEIMRRTKPALFVVADQQET